MRRQLFFVLYSTRWGPRLSSPFSQHTPIGPPWTGLLLPAPPPPALLASNTQPQGPLHFLLRATDSTQISFRSLSNIPCKWGPFPDHSVKKPHCHPHTSYSPPYIFCFIFFSIVLTHSDIMCIYLLSVSFNYIECKLCGVYLVYCLFQCVAYSRLSGFFWMNEDVLLFQWKQKVKFYKNKSTLFHFSFYAFFLMAILGQSVWVSFGLTCRFGWPSGG